MKMLNIGQTAPNFTLKDQHGKPTQLNELIADGDLILYFYPADFSPGCTAEACTFRDGYQGVQEVGMQIVGISPQSAASHKRFARSFSIPFSLLSDPGKQTIRKYGVDGPMGFGVRRATFLIDREGVIRNRVIADLMINSHAKLINETVRGRKAEIKAA
ncbi:MAG: peroxiredoxin [Pseudomonadota bacterium]